MSIMGARSKALSEDDILDDMVASVRPDGVLLWVLFSWNCHMQHHHTNALPFSALH